MTASFCWNDEVERQLDHDWAFMLAAQVIALSIQDAFSDTHRRDALRFMRHHPVFRAAVNVIGDGIQSNPSHMDFVTLVLRTRHPDRRKSMVFRISNTMRGWDISGSAKAARPSRRNGV